MYARSRRRLLAAFAVLTSLGALVAGTTEGRATEATAGRGTGLGVVYVGANDPTTDQNSVLAFRREADGSLTPLPGSPFLAKARNGLPTLPRGLKALGEGE